MKTFFLILVLVFMVCAVNAVQPARKPFIQIKIDGKSFRNGDILTVKPGQKLLIAVDLEGGRRDFCKFPDTYADIAGTAQILSRGNNGLTYLLDGEKAEWKLISENYRYTTDDFIKVSPPADQPSVELNVTKDKFAQSSVKITIKAEWQFNRSGKTSLEENVAETTIYFKVAGSSDVWFISQNVQASGIKNELVQEKLLVVQSACDSIEHNFYHLNFSAVQQGIRNLQNTVNILKSTIDEVKAGTPSYQSKIIFLGLPSDHPYSDIEVLSSIKTNWESLGILVSDLKQKVANLPAVSNSQNKDELVKIITQYVDWQYKLAENTFALLPRYLPEINLEQIKLPGNIHFIAEEKSVDNYSQTILEFQTFLDNRIEQVSDEIQKINAIHTRIQAVRLFDGMLRSYFSSINWAEWKSTRGY